MTRSEKKIAERVEQLWWEAITYGEIEQFAGVTDRATFWRQFREEAAAKAELERLITERVRRGEL